MLKEDSRFPFEADLLRVHCDCYDPGDGRGPRRIDLSFYPRVDADQREVIQDGPHPTVLYRVAEDTRNLDLLRGPTQVCWVVVEGSTHTGQWSGRILDAAEAATVREGKPARAKGGPVEDGPVSPDGFAWGPKVYRRLANKPFSALQFLWGQPNRTARYDELAGPVWGDSEVMAPAFGPAGVRRQINLFFDRHRIPYHAEQGNGFLTIRDGKPRPPRRTPKPKAKKRRG